MLRDLKAGESSEAEAMARLERSPYWAWTAIDPESQLLVVIESGSRTLAMAHRVVPQVGQKLAASCVPVCLTGGYCDCRHCQVVGDDMGTRQQKALSGGDFHRPGA